MIKNVENISLQTIIALIGYNSFVIAIIAFLLPFQALYNYSFISFGVGGLSGLYERYRGY